MKRKILITSIGGPAATNIVKSFKLAGITQLIGVDCDPLMIKLSALKENYLVARASDINDYLVEINWLAFQHKVTMLYPQSDIEVFICSKYRSRLPSVCLPKHKVIKTCRDKGKLYQFLKKNGFPVPEFRLPTKENIRKLLLSEGPNYGAGYGWQNWYPCWVRARTGAGGNKGFIARDWRDFYHMAGFWKEREDVKWMLVKLLKGRDYCWTSIWKDGVLLTSVLKERLRWVYNRIGTTAAQRTVHNQKVNRYCFNVIKALDPKITGIMMVDLKEDTETGIFYITEINAGRLGTVNYWFAKASKLVYGDHRVNFSYILYKIHHGDKLPLMKKFDALPIDILYLRHIDMGDKLILPP